LKTEIDKRTKNDAFIFYNNYTNYNLKRLLNTVTPFCTRCRSRYLINQPVVRYAVTEDTNSCQI